MAGNWPKASRPATVPTAAGTFPPTVLQVWAALLSEDDRLARHFAQRPGSPYRRRKAG
jgi:hypothetical protein